MLRNPSPLKQYDEDIFLDPNTSVAFQTKQDDPSTPDVWEGDKDTPEYEAWKRRKKQFKEQNKDVKPEKKAATKEAAVVEDMTNAGVTEWNDDGTIYSIDHQTGLRMKNGITVKGEDFPKKYNQGYKKEIEDKDPFERTSYEMMHLHQPDAEDREGFQDEGAKLLSEMREKQGRLAALNNKRTQDTSIKYKGALSALNLKKIPIPDPQQSIGGTKTQKSAEWNEWNKRETEKQDYLEGREVLGEQIKANPMATHVETAIAWYNDKSKNPTKKPPTEEQLSKKAIEFYTLAKEDDHFENSIRKELEEKQGVLQFGTPEEQEINEKQFGDRLHHFTDAQKRIISQLNIAEGEIVRTDNDMNVIKENFKIKHDDLNTRALKLKTGVESLGENFMDDMRAGKVSPEKIKKYEELVTQQQQLTEDYLKYKESAEKADKELDSLYSFRDRWYKTWANNMEQDTQLTGEGEDMKLYHEIMGQNHHNATFVATRMYKWGVDGVDGLETVINGCKPRNIIAEGVENYYDGNEKEIPTYMKVFLAVDKAKDVQRQVGKTKLRNYSKNLEKGIEPMTRYEDIETPGDIGHWALGVAAQAIPQYGLMYLTGGASIGIMGASVAGNRFDQLKEDNLKYGRDMTMAQIRANSFAHGVFEYFGEKLTYGLFKNVYRQVPKNLIRKGFMEGWQRNLTKYATTRLSEGGSELYTQWGQNASDIHILGENKSYWEGGEAAFASGIVMAETMSMPGTAHRISEVVRGKEYDRKLYDNEKRLQGIEKTLRGKDLSKTTRTSLEETFQRILNDNRNIFSKNLENVDMMTTQEKDNLIKLDVKKHESKRAIDAINEDKSLSPKEKKNLIQKESDDIAKLDIQKYEIIEPYETEKERAKKLEKFEEQTEVVKEKVAKVNKKYKETGKGPKGKVKVFETREEQQADFNDKITEQNAEDQAEIEEMEEVIKEGNLAPENEVEAKEVVKFLKDQIKNRNQESKAIGGSFAHGNIIQQPDGSFNITLNKENALRDEDGNVLVAAHEWLHNVLYKTIGGDPKVQSAMGEAVGDFVKTKKGGLSQEFVNRLSPYMRDDNLGEEVMTVMSNSIMDGTLQPNEGFFTKMGDIIRQTLQRVGLKKIKFDTGKDVYNFIKDYNASIEKNYDSKAIDRLMEVGAGGALIEGKGDPQDIEQMSEADFTESGKVAANRNAELNEQIYEEDVRNEVGELIPSEAIREELVSNNLGMVGSLAKRAINNPKIKVLESGKRYDNYNDWYQEYYLFLDQLSRSYRPEETPGDFGAYMGRNLKLKYGDVLGKLKKGDIDARSMSDENVMKKVNQIEITETVDQGVEGTRMYLESMKDTEDLIETINTIVKEAEAETLLEIEPKYKGVKGELTKHEKFTKEGTLITPEYKAKQKKLEKAAIEKYKKQGFTEKEAKKQAKKDHGVVELKSKRIPISSFFNVLDAVSKWYGVDAIRIIKEQDLDTTQREKAQARIKDNTAPHISMLPKGVDASGLATGIANTTLGKYFDRLGRVRALLTGSTAGLKGQKKQELINPKDFLAGAGIIFRAPNINDTSVDGYIRSLILQSAVFAFNQAIRKRAEFDGDIQTLLAIKDGKSDIMFSKTKDLQLLNEFIRTKGTSEQEVIAKQLNPLWTNIAEQYMFNVQQEIPGGYNYQIFNDPSVHVTQDIKDMFTVAGNQVRWTGGRLWDAGVNGYGINNKNQKVYVDQVTELGATTHPNIDSKTLLAILGIKDSGMKNINGIEYSSQRSVNPKAHPKAVKSVENRSGYDPVADAALLKKHNINPEHFSQATPIQYKGEVKRMANEVWAQPTREGKRAVWEKQKPKRDKINQGNRAVLKYMALKLRESNITPVNHFHMGSMQTNIGEGVRALSNWDWMYMTDNKQMPMRQTRTGTWNIIDKPKKDKKTTDKEYLESNEWNKYNKEWENTVGYEDAYNYYLDNPKIDAIAEKLNVIKQLAAQKLAIDKLHPKNEHIEALATTDAKIFAFVNGADIDIDLLHNGHETFYGPKHLMDNYLDAKIKDPTTGKLVDNKVSLEGPFRMIKFAGPERANIFHSDGRDVSKWVAEEEGLYDFINDIYIPAKRASEGNMQFSKAVRDSRLDRPRKGMSAWDFDDTVARTKSGVRYTLPNPSGKPAPGRKVIFMAGGPGSGKSTVIKGLDLRGQGFKVVNQDISLEWLAKNHGLPTDMKDFTPEQASKWSSLGWDARMIAKRKQAKYQGNGDGIIVDGTGNSLNVMQNQVQKFKNKGYDVQMVFVETSLETALQRNHARKERSLRDGIVIKTHESVQNNKEAFRKLFGDNFTEVKTDNLKIGDPMPRTVVKQVDSFTKGYIKGRLDPGEFADRGADLEAQGVEFDFAEFDYIKEGKKGPLFGKAIDRAKKFGTKDQFILTARPHAAKIPIYRFLDAQGLNIPFDNIITLESSTSESKALWIAEKVGEGYNDIYFADDALQNVQAVKNMLDQFDVKGKVQQAKIQFSKSVGEEFNDILEESKGIPTEKAFSAAKARKRGETKGKYKFFIPPSAEDFKGLIYSFLGKGKKGEAHMNFFKKALLDPFAKGYRELNTAKQTMANDYKALRKAMPEVRKLVNKKIKGQKDYTYGDAMRVYLWDRAGFDIPGLTKTDRSRLTETINSDPKLKTYADTVGLISKRPEGYIQPSEHWLTGNILADLDAATSRIGRKEFLAEWIQNKNIIFSPENLNKIEAIYGTNFREALEDILHRMEKGTNRTVGDNKLVNRFMNWTNNSVGAIMFFNMRSAVLQTLSTVNFINWGDNNIAKAAVAFANQPQFWKDFSTLFNSDMLKQRRKGLKTDVNANEIAQYVANSSNKVTAGLNWLLQKGFLPTQVADSFAIASGGATFYRNRIKTYLKEGLNQKEAETKAFEDFQEVAEETQQSSRPDLISSQQASTLGRLILAFQNTPMQYMRLTKKAISDLVNRRGDPKTHISRIIYYGAIQNVIFYSLQSALFALAFTGDDEEELNEKTEKKKQRILNGMLDSVLRGIGVGGAIVSTLKNVIIKLGENEQKTWNRDTSTPLIEALNLSPPIGSKARKFVSAQRSWNYNRDVIKEMDTFDLDNPVWDAVGNVVSAATNIPMDRLVNKTKNVREALNDDNETWQRTALILGWNRWDLDVKSDKVEQVKTIVKEKKKKISKEKAKIKAEENKKIKQAEEQEKINKQVEEEKKKEKEGTLKDPKCSFVSSKGNRCKISVASAGDKCTVHEEVKQNKTGKKVQCKGKRTNGENCKMMTSNDSGYCYYHD
jgi:chloramphenicol 3-O-phosphotransferase